MVSCGRRVDGLCSSLWRVKHFLCCPIQPQRGLVILQRQFRPPGPRHSPSSTVPCRWFRCSPAHLGPHRKQLVTAEGTREFLAEISPKQLSNLTLAIQELAQREKEELVDDPSWKQLRLLCYQNTLPFIGFGFLDNFIMITVADGIEESFGAILCISTMAAAGLGNMVSDLAGLGLADQVDSLCRAIGIPDPKMSSAQLRHRASRWMGLLGRSVGIVIGCIIGMFPLLWITPHKTTPTPHPPDDETTPI